MKTVLPVASLLVLSLCANVAAQPTGEKMVEFIDLVAKRFNKIEAEIESLKENRSNSRSVEERLATLESQLAKVDKDHSNSIANSLASSSTRTSKLEEQYRSLSRRLDSVERQLAQLPEPRRSASRHTVIDSQHIIIYGSNCDIELHPSSRPAQARVRTINGSNNDVSINVNQRQRVTVFVKGSNNDVDARALLPGSRVVVYLIGSNNDIDAKRDAISVFLKGSNNDVDYR